MPPESPERTRLWRIVLGAEGALVKMIARREFPDEPNLVAAASLLERYRGVRRLERCLDRLVANRRCGVGARLALVVGESPNGRDRPFDGPVGERLAALLGVRDLRDAAEPANLLTDDEVERGATVALLRSRAAALQTRRRVVILCGRAAAAAFGLGDAPFLEWRDVDRAAVVVVPHPSGRNRWWNEEENRAAAERVLGWLGGRLRLALGLPGVEVVEGIEGVIDKRDEEGDNGTTTMSRNLRTTVPEDVGDAIDRICDESGIAPAAWLRALAIREVRFLARSPGGDVYGCVCGHRRSEHHRERDRDGEYHGSCAECDSCEAYRQAPPPQRRAGS